MEAWTGLVVAWLVGCCWRDVRGRQVSRMGRDVSRGLGLHAGLSVACVAAGARAFCRSRMGASWCCFLVCMGVACRAGAWPLK